MPADFDAWIDDTLAGGQGAQDLVLTCVMD